MSYNKLLKRVSSIKLSKKRTNKLGFLFEGLLTNSKLINKRYIKSSLLSGKKVKFLIKNLELIDNNLDYNLILLENDKSELINFFNSIKNYDKLPTMIYTSNTMIVTEAIKKIINIGWCNKKYEILVINKPIKELDLAISFYKNYLIFILSQRKFNE